MNTDLIKLLQTLKRCQDEMSWTEMGIKERQKNLDNAMEAIDDYVYEIKQCAYANGFGDGSDSGYDIGYQTCKNTTY